MKAKYFFMVAAAGLLAACSSNDDLSSTTAPETDGNAKVPISLGVSANVQVQTASTRGTGTVGGTKAEGNYWSGQQFNVYMLNQGKLSLALGDYSEDASKKQLLPIYEDKLFNAPEEGTGADGGNVSSGVATAADGKIEYYPTNNVFDFWGYRIDDAFAKDDQNNVLKAKFVDAKGNDLAAQIAAVDANADLDDNAKQEEKNKIRETATKIVVPFTIDGSQDIMSGKATEEGATEDIQKILYSASAARKGHQPKITFNHHLSRIVFNVVAGNPSAAGYSVTETKDQDGKITKNIKVDDAISALSVNKISVKSPVNGELAVAYTDKLTEDQICKFDADDNKQEVLYVKQRGKVKGDDGNDTETELGRNTSLVELQPVKLTWPYDAANPNDVKGNGDIIKIGDALLIAPGKTEYPLSIQVSQNVKKNSNSTDLKPLNSTFSTDLKLIDKETGKELAFEPGKSYIVTIKVYGLEKIVVSANLAQWEDGGNIDVDFDDVNGNVVYTEPTTTPGGDTDVTFPGGGEGGETTNPGGGEGGETTNP